MLQKILAFLMSILAFFSSLFGLPVETVAYTDVAYGPGENQTMDLYVPNGYDKTVGLVLMLHGGTWQRGDKSSYASTIAKNSSEYGVACASINYRLLTYGGSVSLQDMYDDITAAIETCITIAAEQGKTIGKVMLRGFSAGGHVALMYAYTQQDACPIPITAVWAESAIGDMTDKDLYYGESLAYTENLCKLGSMMCGHTYTMATFDENIEYIKTISPAHCVSKNSVPTLLSHGMQDTVVPYSNIARLIQAMDDAGNPHDVVISQTAGHGIGSDADASAKAESLYEKYIRQYLK